MKFCAINSSFSERETDAINMKAIKEIKQSDCAIISMICTSTMKGPIGRGYSTRSTVDQHGRWFLEVTKAAAEWASIL